MPTMVQVRGVPDDVHRALKARAAEAGESLNAYLLQLLAGEVARPRVTDVLERAARRAERASASAAVAARRPGPERTGPARIELPENAPAPPSARP